MLLAWSLQAPLAAHEAAAAPAERIAIHLDKQEQRRLGIRTQRADAAPPALSLPAKVVVHPRGNARVMADQPGVIEAPRAGFARPGQRVAAGEVLAILSPTLAEPQRRDLEAQLAVAQRDVALGELQVERYSIVDAQNLQGHLLTPSLQIVVDYHGALARQAQLLRALSSRVEIRAPTAGRVLSSTARAGRVAAAGETLFEIDGAAAPAVELLLTDDTLDAAAAHTALASGERVFALQLLGLSLDPVIRTPRALYAVSAGDAPLAVGEPLRVIVPRIVADARLQIPASGVFSRHGRQWVWVHTGAETFAAQAVTVSPLTAGWVRIEHGLQPQQRVVIAGVHALSGTTSPTRQGT